MLKAKNSSKKKFIVYLSIIATTVIGAIILLYENYMLTAETPKLFFFKQTSNSGNDGNPAASSFSDEPATAETSQNNLNKQNSLIDMSIFEDKKFQALKENTLSNEQKPVVGKRNPFEPTKSKSGL